MTNHEDSSPPQHQDPGPILHLEPQTWDKLIEDLGPASCLVVIDSWLGAKLKGLLSAEDIWQESLVLAWTKREQHEWNGVRAYRSWLLTIAKNRIHDHARWFGAQKRGGGAQPALFSEMGVESGASLASLLPAGSTTPSRVASTNERAEQMKLALSQLKPEHAVVLREHLFEEREMADIAQDLGIGISAAWYRFRQASLKYASLLNELISAPNSPRPEAP